MLIDEQGVKMSVHTYRQWIILVSGILYSLILVGESKTIKNITVPHSAPDGYFVTQIPRAVPQCSIESNFPHFQDYFTHHLDGSIVTNGDISKLNGSEIPVSVKTQVGITNLLINLHIQEISAVFHQTKYLGTIYENEKVGSNVHIVGHVCLLSQNNATYRLLTGDEFFTLQTEYFGSASHNNKLVTKQSFNREEESLYKVEIEALLPGGQTAETVIEVHVLDVNDNVPKFPQPSVYVQTTSDQSWGTITTLTATDPDLDDTIRYSLEDEASFFVDPDTGDLYSIEDVLKPGQYEVEVYATDMAWHESEPVKVHINVHSDTLKFQHQISHHLSKRAVTTISKTFEIVENRTSYSSLFSVASVQPRPMSSTEVYELVSASVPLFRPPDINGNVYLKAGDRLDYEEPTHRNIELVFNRTNLNMPNDYTLVEVTLKVQDLNDEKPVFKNKPKPFLATVSSNPAMGETVYTLLAEDPDKNSQLLYNLESGGEGKFRMVTEQDPNTQELVGKIETTVSGPGQFVQGREYTLVVSAQDVSAGSTQKSDFTLVKVLVGFRPPQLFETKFYANVLENSGSGSRILAKDDTFLVIRAKCFQDALENKVLYELTESDGKISSLFSINSRGKVETLQNFDYEEKPNQYMVIVTATEINTGLSSTAQLEVDVMDVNDNSPKFQLSTYTFLLPEDTPIGGPAIAPQVTATDRDSELNGELEYTVSNDNFTIQTTLINNQYIGRIKVAKKLDYDFVTDHQYRFNVTVRDKGNIRRTGQATVIIYVTNVNDEAPVFATGSDHLYASISEEQIVGSVVTIIQATDPDGDNLEYFFTPKMVDRVPFRIDPTSGLITLTTPLPESIPYYTLNITAFDDGSCCDSNDRLTSNTYILVEIKDTNNNQPQFPDCNYSPDVLENQNIGTPVVRVKAVDDDRGDNGNITYSIVTSPRQSPQFEVNPFTGEVITAVKFDREAPQGDRGIAVTVKAADQGKPQSLDSHCTFWVNILDQNDNEPKFDSPLYSTSISKLSAVVGRRVFAVRATDKDQDQNAVVEYTLTDNPGDFFRIEQDTGIIYLNKALVGINDVKLTVKASDRGEIPLSSLSSVEISVTDRTNNDPPTWLEDNYEREYIVQETAQIGHMIASMRAMPNTPPPFDILSFALIDSRENSVQQNGPFRIHQEGDNVTLILKGTLDYNEQNIYELRLRVTNQAPVPLSVEIRPVIKVKDMNNEPPQFEGLDPNLSNSYSGSVPENEAPGQTVLKVKAVDNDHDPPNNVVTYSLMEDKNGVYKFFDIDSKTGVVTTRSQFDREEQSVYYIKVKAVDGTNSDIPNYFPPNSPNSATAQVQVTIADKNDNPPYFIQSEWEIAVPEQRPDTTGRFLTVVAKDKDKADQLAYTITEGNLGNVFGIKQKTGDIYVAKTLDYESPPTRYTLTIMVQDGRYENFTTVFIDVTDVNDNAPEFTKNVYEINNVIEETQPPQPDGEFLVQVFATDKDLSRENRFRYHLSGDGTELSDPIFTIEQNSGKIYLRKKLDRDLPYGREVFQFNVIVEDEPDTNQALSGYAYVKVRPKDINDNSPIFRKEDLHGSVPEHSKADQSVMTVVATDFDAGDNGTVFYEIDRFGNPPADPNGNLLFKINDETGLIQTKIDNSLDREKTAQYFVPIIAKDRGVQQKSSTATVTISVSDINDQVPKFVKKIYRVSMSENLLAGPVVTVSATDNDIDENARLTYTLKESDRTFFAIETMPPNAGVLTVFQTVDYEKHKFFNLTVYVQDNNPDHKDVAYIEVTVQDYNDNKPQFSPQVKTIRHPENIPEGTSLWNCSATDADYEINAEFEYLIDRKTDEGRRFTVDSNCEVKIRRGLDGETLDREALDGLPAERYEVRILAVDKGYPRQTGTATLRILVDDVNDNAPEFVLPHPAMVMELLTPPQFVITFRARDRDTPKYGAPFTFSLPPCEENPTCQNGELAFTMDFDPRGDRGNGTGTVTAMRTFYRDQQKFYYLPVIMSDMRGKNRLESKTGTSTLTIEIGDENNHPHSEGHKDIFVYKYDFKGVSDELAIGNVYAKDLDDWDVVDKYYYFHGPPVMEKYFRIDLQNGQIFMNKDTPAGVHDFTAKVWDFRRFTTINATATVTVTVEEITDQAVYSSGSLRFTGMTAEEFITKPSDSEKSPYEKFQDLLANKMNIPDKYVAIFSVLNGKDNEYTELRIAAHGSPWYPASKLDGIMTLDKAEFEAAAGISIIMINIDMCLRELCESGGCTNTLLVDDMPNYVNANGTSFIGVATTVQAECGCKALDFSSPPECTPTYCYNGGQCHKDDWGDVRCINCPKGFDGPRCQLTKHSFNNGYALFEPFSQCEGSKTSIEFITQSQNGLIFYNGPVMELERDDPTDYIALSLLDGYPVLQIDHGSGLVTLTLDGMDKKGERYLQKLNDGRWHHIDIIRNGKDITMIVDRCEMLNVDALTDTTSDKSPCEVSGTTPGENFYLNVNSLLQLGGRYVEPSQPEAITTNRFKGCMRNLIHNGQLYNLFTDKYTKGENHLNGCPDEDLVCGLNSLDGPKCGPQGACELTDVINKQYKCTCKPGYRTPGSGTETCNTETTVRDLQENSFMIWSLKPEFLNKELHPRTTEVQLRFRTRDLNGILFHLPSNSDKFITLELVGGVVKVQYNLGGSDGLSELTLSSAPASNGQWHTLVMRRIGKWFELKMDGGEGRYHNETWGPKDGHQLISIKMYQIVAGGHVVFSNNPIVNGQDLNQTCITDIRLNNQWLPMVNSENGLSEAATLELEQGVENDCIREDCLNVTCPIGIPVSMVCYPLWGMHECRCPAGTYPNGYNCLEIDYCILETPCFEGSTCVSKKYPDNFTCVCPAGWTGRLCNILHAVVPVTAGITTGFIVIIIVCIFVVLIVALVVCLVVRYHKTYDPERYILDVDPDDDIRENVINYNEEGAGEEDQEGYDIHRLRKPDDTDTLMKSPYSPMYSDRFLGREPGERPDIADFIANRLAGTDNDPNAPPHDSVREFVNEGGGSEAGSLSSLHTGSSDNDQDYDYLNDWGPKFTKLASMYGWEEEEL